MDKNITHMGSRTNLIGKNPTDAMIKLYSNELHVTGKTSPSFLIHATDDDGVPVENSLLYYQALKKTKYLLKCIFTLLGVMDLDLLMEINH